MSDLSIDFHLSLPPDNGSFVLRIEPGGRENDENAKGKWRAEREAPPFVVAFVSAGLLRAREISM